MKIDKLKIKNYKGFKGENLELHFLPDINIFVGINGSGKTSLLDLIAIFLNQFVIKLSGINSISTEYTINQLDINIEETETINKIFLKAPWGEEFVDLSWEIIRDLKGNRNNYQELNSYIKNYQELLIKNTNCNIPILKYFQSQRITNESHKHASSTKRYLSQQLKAYDDAFDRGMEFDEFVNWYVEEENKENREKVAKKDLEYTNTNLNDVRNALKIFFETFPSWKYQNLRVEEREFNVKTSEKSSLVIDKDNKTFNLKQLSDGEKIIILMVSDIAHRLSIANHQIDNALKGYGIVLIDEIDLHLHPAWQRAIIPCLQKTFPNIQFFITTHSPQILSEIENHKVFIIENFKIVNQTPKTYGKDTNSILWDIFGVKERPENAVNDFRELYSLMENEIQHDTIKHKLEELIVKYGENDPEIFRAKLHLDYLNVIE